MYAKLRCLVDWRYGKIMVSIEKNASKVHFQKLNKLKT